MAVFNETAVHHCELVCDEAQVDPLSSWYHCKNQRTHKNFLTVKEFGMEHLPPELRNQLVMDYVTRLIDRTVKVTVSYTSEKRPDTFPDSPLPYPFREHRGSNQHSRCGTGFIIDVLDTPCPGPCPCPECEKSNQPKMEYWEVRVTTATHVVFDESEAKNVTVDVFYDSEDREGVRYLYGVDVFNSDKRRYETDTCEMCCVTHEKDLMERLKSFCDDGYYSWPPFGVNTNFHSLVSHPHGVSKRISIGKYLQTKWCVKPGSSITLDKGTRVSFPSSDDKPEDTHHSDLGGSNGGPPHKEIRLLSQHLGDENLKTNEVVNPQETVTSRSLEVFSTSLTPNTNKEGVRLKVGLEAFPPSGSFIVVDKLLLCDWYTFPADTNYVSRDGTSVVVPTEIKFAHDKWDADRFLQFDKFETYDMATCPGSSGALVCIDWLRFPGFISTHFGICGGKGQSALLPSYRATIAAIVFHIFLSQ